jgi:hypothetical protein
MEAGAGGGIEDPTDSELSATKADLCCGCSLDSVAKASATAILDDGKEETMGLTSAERVDTWYSFT